jgi:hypothetical protein
MHIVGHSAQRINPGTYIFLTIPFKRLFRLVIFTITIILRLMKHNSAEPKTEKQTGTPRSGKKVALICLIILNIIALAVIGWLLWQLKNCIDKEAALEKDKSQLQSQVNSLNAQIAAKSATADAPACSSTITQALKDNIRDAINSDNTAALEGYMASSVKVVFAASEFAKPRTPAEAITDLGYINGSSGWSFALPTATTNSYLAGSYGTGSPGGVNYFTPTTYFGKASDDVLVAFNFDSCAKINQVFISASADLLL